MKGAHTMDKLGLLDARDAELIDRPGYAFMDGNGRAARCWLRMLRKGLTALVFWSEERENRGMSVTNASEELATQVVRGYGLEPDWCLFVEHYPADLERGQAESYAICTYTWLKDREGRWTARAVEWEHIPRHEGEMLLARVVFKGRRVAL